MSQRYGQDEELRGRVRKHLAKFRLTEDEFAFLWQCLAATESLYVEDDEDFSILCEKARNLCSVVKGHQTREEQQSLGREGSFGDDGYAGAREPMPDSSPLVLTDSERARNTALTHYRYRKASFDGGVQWFREEVLQGKMLKLEEALTFVASPVLATLSREDLTEYNISPVRLLIQGIDEGREYNADDGKVHWHLTGILTSSGATIHIDREGPPRPPILWCMALQGDGNYWKTGRAVRESSVLHDLLNISQSLVRQYGWNEVEASLFVLTNMVPSANPIEIDTKYDSFERPMTTIKAEPWISWKTIEKAYKAEQKNVYEVIPGEMGKRNGALFAFVMDHMDENGDLPGKGERRALMHAWNGQADDVARRWEAAGQVWKFSSLEEFNRNLRRAYEEVLKPKYPNAFSRMQQMRSATLAKKAQSQPISRDSHPDSQDE